MKPLSSFPDRMQDEKDKDMNELFQNMRSESYNSSFDEFSYWLNRKTLKNQKMKNSFNLKYFLSHNRLKLAIITFLLLTIAACNMPVTSTNTLGYLLSWNTSKDRSALVTNEIERTVDQKYVISHNIQGTGGEMDLHQMILQNITEPEAVNIQNKVSSFPGISDIRLTPMTNSETMPLYSYAMKNILKIDVNSDGKTDQQITDEINKQIREAGYTGTIVRFENKNGQKRLVLDGSNIPEGGQLEINVNGNNSKEVIKLKRSGPGDRPFENMTDEQVIAKVKKDNPGVEDKDIAIERMIGPDGKEQVKVTVERDEKRP